jgi:uncharacterized protein YheU (UPF0270 family)
MPRVVRFDPDGQEIQPPVRIPHQELSPEALRGVVESFVLREGTDYGAREFTVEEKMAQVMAQIERGEAQILFDPNTETVDIVKAKERSVRAPSGAD